jgi:hypothetical protein
MPLLLAAQIIASRDAPHEAPELLASASATVADLAELTEQEIRAHERGSDKATYVYLLQASLALAGTEPWGNELEGVIHDEYEVPCAACGADNFIAFGKWGCFSTLDDMYMKNNGTQRHLLLPAGTADLGEPAAGLHARALDAGYPGLATKLTYVFGRARCAGCDALFRVDEAVAARWLV